MEGVTILETFKPDPHQGSRGLSYYNEGTKKVANVFRLDIGVSIKEATVI